MRRLIATSLCALIPMLFVSVVSAKPKITETKDSKTSSTKKKVRLKKTTPTKKKAQKRSTKAAKPKGIKKGGLPAKRAKRGAQGMKRKGQKAKRDSLTKRSTTVKKSKKTVTKTTERAPSSAKLSGRKAGKKGAKSLKSAPSDQKARPSKRVKTRSVAKTKTRTRTEEKTLQRKGKPATRKGSATGRKGSATGRKGSATGRKGSSTTTTTTTTTTTKRRVNRKGARQEVDIQDRYEDDGYQGGGYGPAPAPTPGYSPAPRARPSCRPQGNKVMLNLGAGFESTEGVDSQNMAFVLGGGFRSGMLALAGEAHFNQSEGESALSAIAGQVRVYIPLGACLDVYPYAGVSQQNLGVSDKEDAKTNAFDLGLGADINLGGTIGLGARYTRSIFNEDLSLTSAKDTSSGHRDTFIVQLSVYF